MNLEISKIELKTFNSCIFISFVFRSKLSHLQKQVCSHIVNAIAKEASCLRDDWELSLIQNVNGSLASASAAASGSSGAAAAVAANEAVGSSKASDTYCFEMLSMVLALSGSSVGRHYLANQYSLIKVIKNSD